LIAELGLPKPAFSAFELLHRLGDERIPLASDSALVTRRKDGTLVIALWTFDAPRNMTIRVGGLAGAHQASVSRVDSTHGSLLASYAAMGKPANPTRAQIEALRRAAQLPPPELSTIRNGEIAITLPAQALALIEIR
jgi:xylan 1,4-beta-xylosidase